MKTCSVKNSQNSPKRAHPSVEDGIGPMSSVHTKVRTIHRIQDIKVSILSILTILIKRCSHWDGQWQNWISKMSLPCEHLYLVPKYQFVTPTIEDTKILKIISVPSQCEPTPRGKNEKLQHANKGSLWQSTQC